jgi:DNA-binding transcriptional ArsR family regulator
MAIDIDLNLFTSDPRLLVRGEDLEYERAADAIQQLADPQRLRLLHALALGEETPQRAAVWSGLPQPVAERELAAMTLAGIVERRETPMGIVYVPRDGHHVVQLYTALAHGREGIADRHPRMLTRRRLGRTRKVG